MASEPIVEDVIKELVEGLGGPNMAQIHVGEIEGRWAFLLKVTLIVMPFLATIVTAAFIPWSVWVTGNIYMSRQTAELVLKLTLDAQQMELKFQQLPPEEWRERIRALEEDGKQNFRDHQAILITLEQIKSAVVKNDPAHPKVQDQPNL